MLQCIRSAHVNYFDRSFPHSCLVALIMRGLEAHPLVGVYLMYPYLSEAPEPNACPRKMTSTILIEEVERAILPFQWHASDDRKPSF